MSCRSGQAAPVALALAFACAWQPVRGAERPIEAAPAGAEAVIVDLPGGIEASLVDLEPEQTLRIGAWPVAPHRREEIALTRHEVYDLDVALLVQAGPHIAPSVRSPLRFYWGAATADPTIRVLVILDPGEGVIRGLSLAEGRAFDLAASKEPGGGFEIQDADASAAQSGATGWGCGQETLPGAIPVAAPDLEGRSTDHLGSLHSVTVAVDTDTELLALKFANDTTAATNYIASLFAAMNAMYEPDLNIRLLVGATYLRVGSDPWTVVSGGNANVSQLNEFSNYWAANCSGVTRGLAAMLSGKQPSSNSASGIAWINGLCSTSYGYSFTQAFKVDYLAGDARVVGHEIGHNFGSPHTHCYSPPVDTCYNAESGCYSGTTSCPGGPGTIMSYCHVAGCGNSLMQFGATVIAYLDPIVASRVGVCVIPAVTAPTVASIVPARGFTGGATTVTVGGTGFQAGATVTIGGSAATDVVVVNATTITAKTPAHPAGIVNVVVTNPGPLAGTLVGGFTYGQRPVSIPADFSGDGRSEVIVYRAGAWLFFDFGSGAMTGGVWTGNPSATCTPLMMDYDGDGKDELTLFCNGAWHFFNDNGSLNKGIWTGGVTGDLPVPMDVDGDGREEPVVYRGGAWLVYDFASGTLNSGASRWTGVGAGTHKPAPMDFDGDGRDEFTVLANGAWYFFNENGSLNKGIWVGNVTGDIPVPADYDGDLVEDPVVFRGGAWLCYDFATGALVPAESAWTGQPPHYTGGVSLPAPLDVDGDGTLDYTVFAGGPWHFFNDNGSLNKGIWTGGGVGDIDVSARPALP